MNYIDYLSTKLSLAYRVIMLTILGKCSRTCLLCLCENRKYPVSFQSKLNLPLLCFLLDPLTKSALQGMEFYYKFMERFQGISKAKNPAVSKAKV